MNDHGARGARVGARRGGSDDLRGVVEIMRLGGAATHLRTAPTTSIAADFAVWLARSPLEFRDLVQHANFPDLQMRASDVESTPSWDSGRRSSRCSEGPRHCQALRNMNIIQRRMLADVATLDLLGHPPQLSVPVHFVFGEQDALTAALMSSELATW